MLIKLPCIKSLCIKILCANLFLLVGHISVADAVDITDALQHEVRTDENRARDSARKPEQILTFFDVTPQSTVVEVWPGSGWYTEILAPLLAKEGKLYAAHFSDRFNLLDADYMQKSRSEYQEKLESHPVYDDVILTEFAPLADIAIAPPASTDVVLSVRNQLYVFEGEKSMRHALANFYQALKPGGVLGVVAPRLPDDSLSTEWEKSGYVPEKLWLTLAKEAGFSLEGESDLLLNPKDTADHPQGIWSLPPSLMGGEKDKEKYLSIGEASRMVLKFRKPSN